MAGVLTFERLAGSTCSGGGHCTVLAKVDGVEVERQRIDVPAGSRASWDDGLIQLHWERHIAATNPRTADGLGATFTNRSADVDGLKDRRGR